MLYFKIIALKHRDETIVESYACSQEGGAMYRDFNTGSDDYRGAREGQLIGSVDLISVLITLIVCEFIY